MGFSRKFPAIRYITVKTFGLLQPLFQLSHDVTLTYVQWLRYISARSCVLLLDAL